MMSATSLAEYLVDHGLLRGAETIDARLRIRNSSRRNRVLQVIRAAGASYLVKQGVDASRKSSIRREAAVYREMESDRRLRPMLPKVFGYDPRHSILVVELVTNARDLRTYHELEKRTPEFVGEALGRALADIHGHPLPRANFAKPSHFVPGIFRFHTPRLQNLRNFSPGDFQVIKIMQQFGFREHLNSLARHWRLRAFIHTDLRWDNCLLRAGATNATGGALKIVDWESGAIGEPAWDVASVLAEYLHYWVSGIPVTGATAVDRYLKLAEVPLERMHPAMRAFWGTYAGRMTRAWKMTNRELREYLLLSIRHTAARLALRTFEDSGEGLSGKMICAMQVSLNIFQRTEEACADLLGLPC